MIEVDNQSAGKIAVVIPASNEELAIRSVVSEALSYCKEVIVVDDGSTDGTQAALSDLKIDCIRHEKPQGKAAALLDGFRFALDHGFTGIITMDGDGQHKASDIPRLLAAAARYPNHIIIGARLLQRDAAPPARRLGNSIADWFISWACGQRIVDTQSGQRYYPRAALELAESLPHSGFVFESEILVEAAERLGMRSVSVPIETRYQEGARSSHFRPMRDISSITRMVAIRLLRGGLKLGHLFRSRSSRAIIVDPTSTRV